jgi:hypothetical protein
MIAVNNDLESRAHHERRVETEQQTTEVPVSNVGTVVPHESAKKALSKAHNMLTQLLASNGSSDSRRNDESLKAELSDLEKRATADTSHPAQLIVAENARGLANRIEALFVQSLGA